MAEPIPICLAMIGGASSLARGGGQKDKNEVRVKEF